LTKNENIGEHSIICNFSTIFLAGTSSQGGAKNNVKSFKDFDKVNISPKPQH